MGRLVVTRREGESMVLLRPLDLADGEDLTITVESIHGNRVQISFDGPAKDYRLVREEVLADEDPTERLTFLERKSA
jgi:sRNA-binding carbon storage regulator CsrA